MFDLGVRHRRQSQVTAHTPHPSTHPDPAPPVATYPTTQPPNHLQAAVASVLGKDVTDVGGLSPQDLFFCGKTDRKCGDGAALDTILDDLKQRGNLLLERCLP